MQNLEKLSGVIERITYHNEQNGWSVLKVANFRDPSKLTTVLVHQAQVYAGATVEFWGEWSTHPVHGEQFKAQKFLEKKPATAAALEKYLGSGLIKGVGPSTAKKIVQHFAARTLDVFESSIDELTDVPGIAHKKLEMIKDSWNEHRSIRDVMIFLQGYGISTLFATKIYKKYGDQAIEVVSKNPYRLAKDIYGIGFFSADRIALAMGFERRGEVRVKAGILQSLAASREAGHCFLTKEQIYQDVISLLQEEIEGVIVDGLLEQLLLEKSIKFRQLQRRGEVDFTPCYYSKSLYYDEKMVAEIVKTLLNRKVTLDKDRVSAWVSRYCEKESVQLSEEQYEAVCGAPGHAISVLTGGPGCGKTTCTKVLVDLLCAMGMNVTLVAPTGRASQRMTEVMGRESKTVHRLLGWSPFKGSFDHDQDNPLETDFLVLDEASMLDISLAASLLQALPDQAQVLIIGDPDQLPAVGAGNFLADLLATGAVPKFRLTQVFRQAQSSSIVRFAHEMNRGERPVIPSPVQDPDAFTSGADCLFVDASEATNEQLRFLKKLRVTLDGLPEGEEGCLFRLKEEWLGRVVKQDKALQYEDLTEGEGVSESELKAPILSLPPNLYHADLHQLVDAETEAEELMALLGKIHPLSTLRYGMSALQTLTRFYLNSIPKWFGRPVEVQVLCPQIRGSLGTQNVNQVLQNLANPATPGKPFLQMGDKVFRLGDRVIQTRNNYNLGVFNGDIGKIVLVDSVAQSCEVVFSGGDERQISYNKEDLTDLQLAYAITIHKSQGSEFEVVIIPVLGQHFNMLYRNLIYTGLTRAKKLALFIGDRRALNRAIAQIDNRKRQSALTELIEDFKSR